MPKKLMAWNIIAQVGNSTSQSEANELIKKVKKKEVQKQGKASTARQVITHQEFLRVPDYLKAKNQDTVR